MFYESGAMRICKAKAELKNRLAKECSTRHNDSTVTSCVLDGSAVLWVIHWPAKGTVKDFVQNFKVFLARKLLASNVYLIFDRYREWSTKSSTREARECEASRVYQLSEHTPLPSQKAVLTVSGNKEQLMRIVNNDIISDKNFTDTQQQTSLSSLATTSQLKFIEVLSFPGMTLQHLTKKQIISLLNKLSCVQRNTRALQLFWPMTRTFFAYWSITT